MGSSARPRRAPVFLAWALALCLAGAAQAQERPMPVVLGVANAAAPAFSSDGRSVYVGMRKGTDGAGIVKLTRLAKGWSAPVPAAFSTGAYRDLEPAFAPDGRYLVFASNRPDVDSQALLDGHYNGALQAGKGGALWQVDFAGDMPGMPFRLPDLINSVDSVFSPALTADGSLYFMRAEDGQAFHIFRAQLRNGQFDKPVPVPFTDARYGDYDPAVSPHETFVIFSSDRPPAPKGGDLFISFRKGIAWSTPTDLREAISPNVYGFEARLSPDAKTLYFVNSRAPSGAIVETERYLWQVDLTRLLRANGLP